MQFERVDELPEEPLAGVTYVTRDGTAGSAVVHFVSIFY